ncbi:MAG: hypothetical protein IK081_10765 [Lachnospiraceae bacterium]|nr:hypothetical protein [Lachnospiraceae bacterium]
MFREDVVEKERDPRVVILLDIAKSAIYGLGIHIVNYSFRLPAVYSVLPLMLLLFCVTLITRATHDKKRQYAFGIPYVLEYFGFCLYFYNKGSLMPLTAICMTAILAVWCVVCIECFTKDAKKNLIGFLTLLLVAAGAIFLIWNHYSEKARDAVVKIVQAKGPEQAPASEVDALSRELNVVFYSKPNLKFRFTEVSGNYESENGEYRKLYDEFVETLTTVDGKWIGALFDGQEKMAKSVENMVK